MKIICTQENLKKAINQIGKIPKKDSTLPILDNILIEAEDGKIQLKATDLEIGIVLLVRGKIEKEGAVTVPSALLMEYINSLPNQNIEITADDTSIEVTCGHFNSKMLGSKKDDFPLIPRVNEGKKVLVSSAKLREGVLHVLSFSASDETRPEITGVYCTVKDGKMILAATDGYRLAEMTLDVDMKSADVDPIILPKQTLQELVRILEEGSGVEMKIEEGQVMFTFQDAEITSRLIEGSYPQYQNLVPQEFATTVRPSKKELIGAVKATSLFGKHNVQDVVLETKDDELHLSSEASQVGESRSSVPITKTGEENSITFNSRYLIEGLTHLQGDEITISLNTSGEPVVITSKDMPGYFYLLMPIKH